MNRIFLVLVMVVGVMLWSTAVPAGQYQDQRLIEELQRQNQAVMEQQRRQFEEQQLQRQTEEINRIGEETIVILGVDKLDEAREVLQRNWIHLIEDEIYSL